MNLPGPRFVLAAIALASPAVALAAAGAAPSFVEPVKLETVTVTGSNLKGIELERALPVTRIDADQIELTGALSTGDVLQTLPQVEGSIGAIGPTAGGPNDAGGDSASVNLRGLGDGNTLTLLNGRRLSVYGIAPNTPPVVFVNVNQIPLAAVDRVEVLRDGASAIYGSEATGGVVNFILKPDYEGAEARVRHGAARGGYDEFGGSFAFGRKLAGGRSHLSLLLSYYRRDGLDARNRWFSADSDKTALVGAPFNTNVNFNGRSSSSPYGRFSRINSYAATGAIANSTSFFVQPSVTGSGVEVVAGTGPTASENPQTTRKLIGDVKRYNTLATFDRTLTPKIDLFGEGAFYWASSYTTTGEIPISGSTGLTGTDNVIVPASNYYNPYGTRLNPGAPRDVLIRNYRPVEIGPRTFHVDIDSFRLLGGLRGRIGDTWTWETGALHAESLTKDFQGNLISQSRFLTSLAGNTPDAFNVFGGPDANRAATLDQVRITDWTRGTGELTLLDAKATGDLADFRGGPIKLAVGGEFRHEQLRERNGPFGLADDVIAISGQIDVTARREVHAGYAELAVPVVGESDALPLVRALELSVAGRAEDFGRFHAARPKFGAALLSRLWLKLRGSYGEGFRAPTVSQLFQPVRSRRNAITDTVRAGQEDAPSGVSKLVLTGGNPDLQPEDSRSWNGGVVLDVPALQGLTLTFDAWGITQVDRIDSPSPQDEVNQDAAAWRNGQGSNPNVVRAARTAADLAAGLPGPIISIDGAYQNLGKREVQGYDFGADYRFNSPGAGRVSFHGEASRYLVLRDTDANGAVTPLIRQNQRPRWRAATGVSWARSAWSAGAFMRYVGDYDGDASLTTSGVVYKIDSWTVFNAYVGYRFSHGLLKGGSLRVGANNLFDRDPPFDPATSDGYDPANANAWGRLVYTEVRWKW